MMNTRPLSLIFSLPFLLSACHRANSAPPPVPRSQQESVQSLAADIQSAPDGLAEANALKRLRQYAIDHKYMTQVTNYRVDSTQKIPAASARTFPIRTEVSLFRAEQPVYTFTFVPKDNRNIEIIAKGD